MEVMSVENPLFTSYLFYTACLVMKMMVVSLITAGNRVQHKAFPNQEDADLFRTKIKMNEDVERSRRAHLNDMESIPIFFAISFAYILTNPPLGTAVFLFRTFLTVRIIHTIIYAVYVVPQPARALAFGVGYFVTGYMAFVSAFHFYSYNRIS